MTREEALAEILSIAKRHHLSLADIAEAFHPLSDHRQSQKKNIINHVLGYLGGLLIFAGIIIFIAMKWDDIHVIGQISLTFGIGFCAFIMALTCARQHIFEKAATPLFIIAFILQPIGVVIFLQEYTSGIDSVTAVFYISLIFLIQQGLVFIATQRTFLLLTSLFFLYGAFIAAFDLLDIPYKTTGLTLSLSLLLLSWAINQTRHQPLAPLLFLVSSLCFFGYTFDILQNKPYEILFLGISCAFIFIAIASRTRTLLVTATVALLSYIGYFTGKHFPNTIGWPITLIIMGIFLIFLSSMVIKLDRKYIKPKAAKSLEQ